MHELHQKVDVFAATETVRGGGTCSGVGGGTGVRGHLTYKQTKSK